MINTCMRMYELIYAWVNMDICEYTYMGMHVYNNEWIRGYACV